MVDKEGSRKKRREGLGVRVGYMRMWVEEGYGYGMRIGKV